MDRTQAVTGRAEQPPSRRAPVPPRPTADLCDEHPAAARVLPPLRSYGGRRVFAGRVSTLRVYEDWRPVLAVLDDPGDARVLVVDAGASLARAVLGGRLLTRAHERGWAGVVVHGAVRDLAETREVDIGLRALGTAPMRGESGAASARDVVLDLQGVRVAPGDVLHADEDGIVVLAG